MLQRSFFSLITVIVAIIMFSRVNFATLFLSFKQLASLIKNASIEIIAFNRKSGNNFQSKIIKTQTKTTNKYFAIIIIVFCFITIALSYYEQCYQFQQQLFSKADLAHNRLEEKITHLKHSLGSIKTTILKNNRYLDSTKVIQILKLGYTNNKYLSLLPLSWHPILEKYKYYSAFGYSLYKPDDSLLNTLRNNSQDLLVSDFLDELSVHNLILILPVTEPDNQNLLGYLKMHIEIPQLLQPLYDSLSDSDLLKLSVGEKVIYFFRQQGEFAEQLKPTLSKYQFIESLDLFANSYNIAIAQEKAKIIANTLQTVGLRCGIILALGSIMLLIYNYIERKKAISLCNDNELLAEEISSQEKQIQDLTTKLESSNNIIEDFAQQKNKFLTSKNIIGDIERQVRQDLSDSLIRIRDVSLLKQHNANKEITPEIINKTLASIHRISEDLINNVVSRNSSLTGIDIADLFDELFILFAPIISNRSIKLEKKIDHIDIITNELSLRQVLISLLFRVFSSSPESANIKITATKGPNETVVIEIINDGYSLSEQMINSILDHGASNLPSNLDNIQVNYKFIERIVQEILAGEFIILKKNHNNKMSLSLPLKRNKYETSDNIIDFYQIAK